MALSELSGLVETQRGFFDSGKTKDPDFRIAQLKLLQQVLVQNEPALYEALKLDLNKAKTEAYLSEIGLVIGELSHAIRHLRGWAKPRTVWTPTVHFPAVSRVHFQPLGVVLILGPWNYPVQLALAPLIAAMAAGDCAVIKPSEFAPHTSELLARIVRETFEPAYVAVVEGAAETAQALLEEKFDHIFFTGGSTVGKIVAAAAAKHLTPVTLELGGKSPCIVDDVVDLETAAKRIVWGKFLNAGQTCAAPDYLLVNRNVKEPLLEKIVLSIRKLYGADPRVSPDYGRIITQRHFERLAGFLGLGDIVTGGRTDPSDRYIAPTVIDNVRPEHPIMQEEIFGPILPVLEYGDLTEAISFVNSRPRPLTLYAFSSRRDTFRRITAETCSGGATFNDTLLHLASPHLPFGGVGDSGYGRYHGKAGFETFSNQRSILYKPFWLDVPLRYPPYGNKLPWIRRAMRFLI